MWRINIYKDKQVESIKKFNDSSVMEVKLCYMDVVMRKYQTFLPNLI